MMKHSLTVGILALMLASCAFESGVMDMGGGTYFLSRQAATGFTGLGTLPVEARQEATAHCSAQDKTTVVTEEVQSPPPYILGNFPRVDLTFRCE